MNARWTLAFICALLNDASDIGLSWIPLAPVPFDVITAVCVLILTKAPLTMLGAFEIPLGALPGASAITIMPFWTMSVLYAYNKGRIKL